MNITIDDLLNHVKTYNPEEVEIIKKKHMIMLIIYMKDKLDKVENSISLIL